jgi:hypothetical protein
MNSPFKRDTTKELAAGISQQLPCFPAKSMNVDVLFPLFSAIVDRSKPIIDRIASEIVLPPAMIVDDSPTTGYNVPKRVSNR